MNTSINRVVLIGRLDNEPELQTSESLHPVCLLWLLTDEAVKDRYGTISDTAQWHRVVAWGKLAQSASQFFQEGDKLYIAGRLTRRLVEDTDNQHHVVTEIVAEEMLLLHKPSPNSFDDRVFLTNPIGQQEFYTLPSAPDPVTIVHLGLDEPKSRGRKKK